MKSIVIEKARAAAAEAIKSAKSIRALARNVELRRAADCVAKIFAKKGWGASVAVGASSVYIYTYPTVESFALNAELLAVLESISLVMGDEGWKETIAPANAQGDDSVVW